MIIAALLVTVLLEQLMFTRLLWEIRLFIIIPLTFLIPAISTVLVAQYPHWLGITVALLSIGRVFNLIRIAQARMHEGYLQQATQRTSRAFSAFQVILTPVLSGVIPVGFSLIHLPRITATVQLIVAAWIVYITIRNMYQTRYRQGVTFYADRDLPTVSLLIPARNETTDLEECLRSALASDYPKLEIIVLDDCSQAKTSDIIKGFAHDGVRFTQGEEPQERWLAKNQAYQRLTDEASGDLLLFCGVDVRFGTHAIKALVTELLNRDKEMISILPRRLSGSLAGAFIQPMRYWWELSLPRRLFNRPAVLSTCWLIKRKALKRLGNFNAVSHSIIPEGFFARELVKTNDYSFIRANDTLDIQTHKLFTEQRATALRTRYPQLRRRPENVLLFVIADLLFLLGPFIGIIYGLIANDSIVLALSAFASALLILNHVIVVQLTSPPNVVVALINFPVEVLTEVVISVLSMVRYEFGAVEWKDRNVCIPVMHVVPHLPQLKE
jgi:glycosyltransferase involved in cell wall biosynthesis